MAESRNDYQIIEHSDKDYAVAREHRYDRSGDHHWERIGRRGRCVDYKCSDENCNAVHVEVSIPFGDGYGLKCEFHGTTLSSICYSCEATPWRYGSDWGRCKRTDTNAYGDILRCALYSGHTISHETTCPSINPERPYERCWLPYGHEGDNHASRNGEASWFDDMIGPPDRKII